MAPMKFEENIKQKLDGRKIKPSDSAWERIAKNLDDQRPKKQKPKWLWIAVAASFVGILILAGNFLGPDFNNTKNQVVTVPTQNDSSEKEIVPDEMLVQGETVLEQEKDDTPFGERFSGADAKVRGESEKTKLPQDFQKEKNAFAEAEKTTQKPSKITKKFEDPALNRSIDREVDALLATVDSLRKNDQQVTEADVDALLAQAQQKLLIDHEFSSGAENLSAEALLRETESEIDRSFRDKIFDALKEGYLTTREALASRNN